MIKIVKTWPENSKIDIAYSHYTGTFSDLKYQVLYKNRENRYVYLVENEHGKVQECDES